MSFARLWELTKKGLSVAKDAALSGAGPWLFNHFQIGRLGHMTSFQIDSERQLINLSLDLHGEERPIDLTLAYQLIEEGGEWLIEITRVDATRQWIATLANEIIPPEKRRHVIPPLVKAALTKIVK